MVKGMGDQPGRASDGSGRSRDLSFSQLSSASCFWDKWDLPVLGISTTSSLSPSDVEETGSNFPEVDVI